MDYWAALCNTHVAVWIHPHAIPLTLLPKTASNEVSCVLCGWSLSALYACRSCMTPVPSHLASGFPSHHQTCWHRPFLPVFQTVCFHLLHWLPVCSQHTGFPCISCVRYFQPMQAAHPVLVSVLHTISLPRVLHLSHPSIPHFFLHSSRFLRLCYNRVLLVLHYAKYFSGLLLPVLWFLMGLLSLSVLTEWMLHLFSQMRPCIPENRFSIPCEDDWYFLSCPR